MTAANGHISPGPRAAPSGRLGVPDGELDEGVGGGIRLKRRWRSGLLTTTGASPWIMSSPPPNRSSVMQDELGKGNVYSGV